MNGFGVCGVNICVVGGGGGGSLFGEAVNEMDS